MSCFWIHKYLRTFKMTYSFVKWLIAYNSFLLESKRMNDTHVWHCNTRFIFIYFSRLQMFGCNHRWRWAHDYWRCRTPLLHTPYYKLSNNNSCINNSIWNLFDRQIDIALIPQHFTSIWVHVKCRNRWMIVVKYAFEVSCIFLTILN